MEDNNIDFSKLNDDELEEVLLREDDKPETANASQDDIVQQAKEEGAKEESFFKSILNMALYCLTIVVVTYLIVHFVGQRTIVVGDSMNNTLYNGDNLIVDKLTYNFSDPKRFDIVVFPFELEEDTFYIKRIIGLPGEKIRIDYDGNIYINGELLEENYGREIIEYPGSADEEITIGEDQYFVLGDNRNESEDSRFDEVGLIDREKLVGRAILRIYPFSSFGTIKNGND